MAQYDGTLMFNTKLDATGLNKELKSLDKGLGKIQKGAVAGFGAIATGLAAAGAAGVKYNAQLEQYQIALTTMTGSALEAEKIMAQIKEDAAKTPFDVPGLTQANQLLLSTGLSADEARETILALGDAVSATGGGSAELARMAVNLQQVKNIGKATALDIKQFAFAGIDIYGILADYLGITKKEAAEMEITWDDLNGALINASKEGGKYFGAMVDQSKTFNGMMSTLKDAVQSKLGEAFEKVNETLVKMLPKVIKFIEELDVDKVVNGLKQTVIVLASIFAAATALRAVLKAYRIVSAVKKIGGLSVALGNLLSNIKLIITTLAPITLQIMAVIAVIVLVGLTIKHLWETNETFREIVMNVWNSIKESLMAAWTGVIQPVLEALKIAIQFFIDYILPVLWEVWQSVFMGIATFLQGIWQGILKPVFDSITGTLSGIIEFLQGVFTGNWEMAWQGIVDTFGSIFGGIVAIAKAPINAVIGLINGAIGALNNISVDIPDWVPHFGGRHFGVNLPTIPYLQKGGILARGQVGYLEGNGAEAVVPLERNKYWINAVAKEFARVMPQVVSSGQTINIYQPVKSPDETARAIRLERRYGLQGA